MKRRIWLNHLLCALFAFGLSVSTVGCLITGFDLPVSSMGHLIFCCGIMALFVALLLRFKYGGTLILCLSTLGLILLLRQGSLQEQLETLLLSVTTHFHRVYNWPEIGAYAAKEVDLPLMVLAGWTVISISYYVCRRSHILAALPSAVLPLVVCLIVTNTVPDEIHLYILILGVSLLLLTDWVRRNNPAQSPYLTLRMAIPVAAALAVLFMMNPREGYVNHAAEFQKEAVNWFQQLRSLTEEVANGSGTDAAGSERLNLRSVGPKSRLSYSVMRVTSPVNGTLYLRGQDYDTYTGTGWEATQDRTEIFTFGGKSVGQLTITTYGTRNVLYVPYYSADAVSLSGGCVDNEENLSRYDYELSLSPAGSGYALPDEEIVTPGNAVQVDYDFDPEEQPCLKLGSSRLWAESLVQEITSGCRNREESVQAIGDYVRNSAIYDLSTSRMSADAEDFARWFLEESDTGYCVHFATAATVLLRAAGIPARYVEGYMVSCRADDAIVVSNQSAHAWAEYYDPNSDAWTVLEATPTDAAAETVPDTPIHTDPVDTEPPETQTAATLPKENEEPSRELSPGVTESTGQKASFRLPGWVSVLLWFILAMVAVILQGRLRMISRRRLWNRGNPNEMALERWKQSEQLSRLLHIPLPEELDALAQKAKFSQHTLTREELQQFEDFRGDAQMAVETMPWYRKWFLRWIIAIG